MKLPGERPKRERHVSFSDTTETKKPLVSPETARRVNKIIAGESLPPRADSAPPTIANLPEFSAPLPVARTSIHRASSSLFHSLNSQLPKAATRTVSEGAVPAKSPTPEPCLISPCSFSPYSIRRFLDVMDHKKRPYQTERESSTSAPPTLGTFSK